MSSILKLLVFGLVLLLIVVAAVASYRFLNKKILASSRLTGVLGYALLLILSNVLLIYGGVWTLIKVYGFLSVE